MFPSFQETMKSFNVGVLVNTLDVKVALTLSQGLMVAVIRFWFVTFVHAADPRVASDVAVLTSYFIVEVDGWASVTEKEPKDVA